MDLDLWYFSLSFLVGGGDSTQKVIYGGDKQKARLYVFIPEKATSEALSLAYSPLVGAVLKQNTRLCISDEDNY